jgi:hypothetical protein
VLLVAIFAGGGLVLGLIVGRWWALLGAVGVGLWIGLWEEVEIPGWFFGLLAGGLALVGIGVGVLLRRQFSGRR